MNSVQDFEDGMTGRLPDELMLMILEMTDPKDAWIGRLSLVCRRWKRLVDTRLQHHVFRGRWFGYHHEIIHPEKISVPTFSREIDALIESQDKDKHVRARQTAIYKNTLYIAATIDDVHMMHRYNLHTERFFGKVCKMKTRFYYDANSGCYHPDNVQGLAVTSEYIIMMFFQTILVIRREDGTHIRWGIQPEDLYADQIAWSGDGYLALIGRKKGGTYASMYTVQGVHQKKEAHLSREHVCSVSSTPNGLWFITQSGKTAEYSFSTNEFTNKGIVEHPAHLRKSCYTYDIAGDRIYTCICNTLWAY